MARARMNNGERNIETQHDPTREMAICTKIWWNMVELSKNHERVIRLSSSLNSRAGWIYCSLRWPAPLRSVLVLFFWQLSIYYVPKVIFFNLGNWSRSLWEAARGVSALRKKALSDLDAAASLNLRVNSSGISACNLISSLVQMARNVAAVQTIHQIAVISDLETREMELSIALKLLLWTAQKKWMRTSNP